MAFLFVGPVPFIPIKTKLSIIQGMAGLAGFAYASLVVSSFARAQRAAMNLGYADDIGTYIAISGILMVLCFIKSNHNVIFKNTFHNFFVDIS